MSKAPSTNATRLLKQAGVAYTEHLYRYEEHGGTAVSARELGVDERDAVVQLREEPRGAERHVAAKMQELPAVVLLLWKAPLVELL